MFLSPSASRPDWDRLPYAIGLNAEEILDHTIYAPAGDDTAALASYLDTALPGLAKDYAEALVVACRPLLTEALPWNAQVAEALADPAGHFGTVEPKALRDRLVAAFGAFVNARSPQHVKRAMIAHCEFGLGNYEQAARSAIFAECSKRNPLFTDGDLDDDPRIIETMIDVERLSAARLVEIIMKHRAS